MASASSLRPENVGIKAIEIYFPSQYVEQSELEGFDGVSAGKYTIGLGQTQMSFCDDREDIYSLCLTVVARLLKKYRLDPAAIGRLEVGTETLLDKSKSVKTVLMQLFGTNTNIEGVDTVNACYGGTNAFFNAVNWVESSAWDGRHAIVVAADIALYAKGSARPTGGAGAVALLVGPDAPLVAESGLRGTFMQHAYDFYKPDLASEYPYVDGHYSVTCYTRALDAAYRDYCRREAAAAASHAPPPSQPSAPAPGLDRFDHVVFHAPTCKLVQKSYARLLYHDFLAEPAAAAFDAVPAPVRALDYEASLTDKAVERAFVSLSKARFDERVGPSVRVATLCGNMYCASVWGGLASLLAFADPAALRPGGRVAVFSYGSGLAASFFSFRLRGDTAYIARALDLPARLDARIGLPPATYDQMCDLRKKAHLQKSYTPEGDPSTIASGAYYLDAVDDMYRRAYKIKA